MYSLWLLLIRLSKICAMIAGDRTKSNFQISSKLLKFKTSKYSLLVAVVFQIGVKSGCSAYMVVTYDLATDWSQGEE